MKTKRVLSLFLCLALMLTLLPTVAQADGEIRCYADTLWSVSAQDNTFEVTRSGDLTRTETVYYRTVSLSAVEGQHFTKKTGTLTFGPDENSKSVTVSEWNPTDAYAYQVGATRSYRFEVCDPGGFTLAFADRTKNWGTNVTNADILNTVKDVTVNSGEITVKDENYSQAYHAVPLSQYFSSGTQAYLNFLNAELRMTLTFEAKEKDDGYQHVQILVNQTSNHDEGAGDNNPGTINYSYYMACFVHEGGTKNTTYAKYAFPVTSKGDLCGNVGTVWTSLGNSIGELRQQKFNPNFSGCRASDGRLHIPTNLSTLGIRFDASGNNEDTWYAKNTVAHIEAISTVTPSLQYDFIKIAPASGSGGKFRRGNTIYITLPFNEIITAQYAPTLKTGWGEFPCIAGLGTNVLTFAGLIDNDRPVGDWFIARSLQNSSTLTDLAGNQVTMPVDTGTQFNSLKVSDDYSYTIEYDLGVGSDPGNRSSYTYTADGFTLIALSREGCRFDGWTGTGLTAQTSIASIPKGSHGDRRYVANWTDYWGVSGGADGGAAHPYLLTTPDGLIHLRDRVNDGSTFSGTYFRLGSDINMQGISFDTIGYFDRTGTNHKPFSGNLDGCGYTIRNLNASNGLFWRIDHATVSNLTITQATVSKDDYYVGTLAGMIEYSTISNCVVRDSSVSSSISFVGGFVGNAEGSTFNDCVVENTTVSGVSSVGGFCGYFYSQNLNCFVIGTGVTATKSGVGPIVGPPSNPNGTMYYYNCTVNGAVPTADSHTVYTVTAGEGITVSGTVAKTYDNVNYYRNGATTTLAYTGEVPEGCELAYSVNGTRIEGNSFSLTADATVNMAWRKQITVRADDQTVALGGEIETGPDKVSVTSGALESGHSISGITLTASGTEALTDNGTITPGGAVIRDASENDVTDDYVIAYESGVLYVRTPRTVSFEAGLDGVSGSMEPVTVPDGVAYVLPVCAFTAPEGFVFLKWSVRIGSAEAVRKQPGESVVITEDTTVTALWEDTNYPAIGSIHFDAALEAYEIANEDNLHDLAVYVNGSGTYSDGVTTESTAHDCTELTFKVVGNIALTHTTEWNDPTSTENNYTPISGSGNRFSGTFDGCGYTISGIRIYKAGNDDSNDCYLGLFGKIIKGTVKNVRLSDTRITGFRDVGGIAGINWDGTVSNCTVTADVCIHAVVPNAMCHGGIVGENYSGSTDAVISGCSSSVQFTLSNGLNGASNRGGIVGWNRKTRSKSAVISNCLVLGAVVMRGNNGNKYVGAIVGCNLDGSDSGTLSNNYYSNCTVGNDAYSSSTDVGVGNASGMSDATENDGARGIGKITLGEGVTITGGIIISTGGTEYYYAGAEMTLSASREGYSFVEYTSSDMVIQENEGVYSFHMPAKDVSVTATWRKLLTHSDITVTIPAQYATGSVLTPEITVMDGETTLEEGTDYTVGDWSGELIDPGTYTATLTGIGDYGGSLTVSFTISNQPDTPRYFPGHALTLAGDIGVNFFVNLYDLDKANAKVVFNWGEDGYARTKTVSLSGMNADEHGYYVTTAQVFALQMTDKIHAALYDGETLVAEDEYSVADYARYILESDDETLLIYVGSQETLTKLRALCTAMLNYGAASQYQFNYRTDDLAADLSGVSFGDVTGLGTVSFPEGFQESTGLQFAGSTLVLRSETAFRLYFTVTDQEAFDNLTVTLGDQTLTPGYNSAYSSYVYYEISDIPAAQLLSDFTLHFDSMDVTANAGYYINSALIHGDETTQRTMTALYWYGKEAQNYFREQ